MDVSFQDSKEEDLDFILSTERSQDNSPYIDQWSKIKHIQVMNSVDRHLLIMVNGKKVGYLILRGIEKRIVELTRIAITEKGKGYGRQAIQLVKQFVFDDSGFHRLWLDVIDGNDRAVKLYESEGFVHEGTLRQAEYYDGKFHDLHLYSIISDDLNDKLI